LGSLPLMAGQKQCRADPGQANPDDRRLDVHIAQKVERQEAIDFDAVETTAVRIIVGHDRADENLQQQDAGDDQEIFADPSLTRTQGTEVSQHRIHGRLVRIVQVAFVDEQHRAEGEEGEAEADPGPAKGAGRRRIADQWLERPVLRPGYVCAGAAGDGRQ
jgi:hypothetical protein